MAPLPKRRHSTRRGGKRKAAIKLSLLGLGKCPECGAPKAPHTACRSCGVYAGKAVVSKKQKTGKKRA